MESFGEKLSFRALRNPARSECAVLLLYGQEAPEAAAGQLNDIDSLSIAGVQVPDWNRDLSPWPAAEAFRGSGTFPGGAETFLERLEKEILPDPFFAGKRVYLAGYSLAGLFCLWGAAVSGAFAGFASVSGSLWYDGLEEWLSGRELPGMKSAFFSLGDREPYGGNARMRSVGVRTQRISEAFAAGGIPSAFEWNPGNHFREPELRLAKGIRRMLQIAGECGQ